MDVKELAKMMREQILKLQALMKKVLKFEKEDLKKEELEKKEPEIKTREIYKENLKQLEELCLEEMRIPAERLKGKDLDREIVTLSDRIQEVKERSLEIEEKQKAIEPIERETEVFGHARMVAMAETLEDTPFYKVSSDSTHNLDLSLVKQEDIEIGESDFGPLEDIEPAKEEWDIDEGYGERSLFD